MRLNAVLLALLCIGHCVEEKERPRELLRTLAAASVQVLRAVATFHN
jgi:hypothetical protein